jgi:hypothetical protein
LRIQGVPVSNPALVQDIASQLAVNVISGPILNVLPYTISITGDNNGARPGHFTGLLENAGRLDLTVSSLSVTGAGATQFVITTERGGPGPFVLRSGESMLFYVQYLPRCGGSYTTPATATLQVTSNGGNASIALSGWPSGFCP